MSGRHRGTAQPRRVAVTGVHGEYRLISAELITGGEYLFGIDGELVHRPSRYSVQVGFAAHIDLPGAPNLEGSLDRFYWRFMNHSCEPNALIRGDEVFTLRPIARWEEITFHYNTTEYDMHEKFDCCCGSSRCQGRIQGFRYLSRSEQEQLRPWLGAYLLCLLDSDAVVRIASGYEGGVPFIDH